jgi:AhpC/TSA family
VSEDSGGVPGGEGPSGATPPRRRLDPDRAGAAARRARQPGPPPVIDTRPYQRFIGLLGVVLVVVISIAFLTSHHAGTAGVPAGQRIDRFAAPLAASSLNGAANLHPTCSRAKHERGALNVCLIVAQQPLVLGFFVTNSASCERIVNALQTVSHEFRPSQIAFAAVAVRASHAAAAAAVRAHHWSIPVGYDEDGRVGDVFGVEVCPIVELVNRGGVVARRLIGDHWTSSTALAGQVRAALAAPAEAR